MIALKDFRYRDLETGQTVEVRQGQPVTERVLKMHRDPELLIRTRYVAPEQLGVVAPKRKRGRPKKG